MPRLIDADALQEQIDNLCSDRNENWIGDEQKSYILHSDVSDIIFDAPTIEIPKVIHGYWIDMQEDDATEGMWRCSVCSSDRYFDIMTPAECGCYYCPNCGAKMDSDVNE